MNNHVFFLTGLIDIPVAGVGKVKCKDPPTGPGQVTPPRSVVLQVDPVGMLLRLTGEREAEEWDI